MMPLRILRTYQLMRPSRSQQTKPLQMTGLTRCTALNQLKKEELISERPTVLTVGSESVRCQKLLFSLAPLFSFKFCQNFCKRRSSHVPTASFFSSVYQYRKLPVHNYENITGNRNLHSPKTSSSGDFDRI